MTLLCVKNMARIGAGAQRGVRRRNRPTELLRTACGSMEDVYQWGSTLTLQRQMD